MFKTLKFTAGAAMLVCGMPLGSIALSGAATSVMLLV